MAKSNRRCRVRPVIVKDNRALFCVQKGRSIMKIITISREFGIGGRELGKRLADALGVLCYDHEIIDMVAEKCGLDKNYVAHVSEKDIRTFYP